MKGCYILLIKLDRNLNINIGKLGNISFKKGFYAYIGSAMNSLENRIDRHIRKTKKFHWHIDYLLEKAKIIDIYYKESNVKDECKIARIFCQNLYPIPCFGCSDCKCSSHLFYGSINKILKLILKTKMIKYDGKI